MTEEHGRYDAQAALGDVALDDPGGRRFGEDAIQLGTAGGG